VRDPGLTTQGLPRRGHANAGRHHRGRDDEGTALIASEDISKLKERSRMRLSYRRDERCEAYSGGRDCRHLDARLQDILSAFLTFRTQRTWATTQKRPGSGRWGHAASSFAPKPHWDWAQNWRSGFGTRVKLTGARFAGVLGTWAEARTWAGELYARPAHARAWIHQVLPPYWSIPSRLWTDNAQVLAGLVQVGRRGRDQFDEDRTMLHVGEWFS